MSTIVYDGHQIVADSQGMCAGAINSSLFQKIIIPWSLGSDSVQQINLMKAANTIKLHPDQIMLFAITGCPTSFNQVVHNFKEYFKKNQQADNPAEHFISPFNIYERLDVEIYEGNDSWSVLAMTANKKVYHLLSETPGFVEVCGAHAIGSGASYAKGALASGATAQKALLAASALDPYTRMPGSSYNIDQNIYHPATGVQ